MGYVPPAPPFRLNVDRHGMPLDYATYVWLLYGKRVDDRSPSRLAFTGPRVERPYIAASRDTR
jgi:hypothetical protein